MIDTHTHIYLSEFDADRDAMISRAQSAGISHLLLPNIDQDSVEDMHRCVEVYTGFCKPMLGLHPCSVKDNYKEVLSRLKLYLDSDRCYCAIGEIGLDYYWDKQYVPQQHNALSTQLEWAVSKGLPFSMHTRDAMDDAISITKDCVHYKTRGVFHCFGGSMDQARKILDLNCALGIGGVVTYKKSMLEDVLKFVPLDAIVLETDAPYLPPVPYRGKRNEPAYLNYIAIKLAEIYQVDKQVIIEKTTANARSIFKLA